MYKCGINMCCVRESRVYTLILLNKMQRYPRPESRALFALLHITHFASARAPAVIAYSSRARTPYHIRAYIPLCARERTMVARSRVQWRVITHTCGAVRVCVCARVANKHERLARGYIKKLTRCWHYAREHVPTRRSQWNV